VAPTIAMKTAAVAMGVDAFLLEGVTGEGRQGKETEAMISTRQSWALYTPPAARIGVEARSLACRHCSKARCAQVIKM
jgi:hypothetical protein